ncbi:MAG: YceI family protein [Burkholderiaceae bacterium]
MTMTIIATLGAALLVATTVANAEPASYTIEPLHSSVVFETKHFGTSTIRAQFRARTGTITIDPAAGTGAANIVIDAASVASGLPKFDENLKSAKFFNVAAYPDIGFVAIDFRFDGDKVAQIGGNLTIIGKSRPVTLNAINYNCYKSPLFNKQVCGGDFVATVKRSEWDLNIGIPFTSDETKLLIQIEATHN